MSQNLCVTDSNTLEMWPSAQPLPRGWKLARPADIEGQQRRSSGAYVEPVTMGPTMGRGNAPTLAGGLPYALWSGNNVVSHRDAHGDLVVERLPSLCHDQIGSDDFHANARTRYVTIVRDNGCTVPLVLTCASSDLDTSQGFAQYQRAKARHYGWFPLAACPLELVTGTVGVPPTLRADQLAISTDDVACAAGTYSEDAPCRHAVAEIQARRTRWNRIQQAREDEANKNAPATPEQIAAAASKGIGETLTKMFGELLAKTATEPAQAEPARVRKARTT